ncbi:trihelix transcription factor ENAP1-like [Amaranthus tricolor]|uniref:trihelix transcription factor ENAP1-like n=1 Tax=Amaranthus tricolor TaxID=29722 RepID=UPI00258305D3|nr:trihelix transcription factor ENAP1-like [Amaranthus tricolor]
MDDKDDSRFFPKITGLKDQNEYCSSLYSKVSELGSMYPRAVISYPGDEEGILEDEESGDENVGINGVRMIEKDTYVDNGADVEEEDEEEEFDDSDDEEEEEEEDDNEGIGIGRPRKKRKLRTLISNYEFAPRLPTPSVEKVLKSPPSCGGKTSVDDWTDRETFAFLDAWGDWFVRLGRTSLHSTDWLEVAKQVSRQTNIERTDAQCRNRFCLLRKKYKKEKTRVLSGGNDDSKWVFYRKMDMLLSSAPSRQTGLSCGVDSGEYVFMNPNVYLNCANGLDEMRDSPEYSGSLKGEEDDSDKLRPNENRNIGKNSCFRLLAESINKFSEIYEKTESNKSKQMVELENMRKDFHRQLDAQRRQILERAQAEIARIQQARDYENDLSGENHSG